MVHRGGFHIVGGKPHGGHVVGFGICPNSLENPNGALSRCLGQFACAKRNHFLQVAIRGPHRAPTTTSENPATSKHLGACGLAACLRVPL